MSSLRDRFNDETYFQLLERLARIHAGAAGGDEAGGPGLHPA